jgi:hypothetical protein
MQMARTQRLPFALYWSVAWLSLVALIPDIGVRTHSIGTHLAAAMVFRALRSVLIFPTLGVVLPARAAAAAGRKPTPSS